MSTVYRTLKCFRSKKISSLLCTFILKIIWLWVKTIWVVENYCGCHFWVECGRNLISLSLVYACIKNLKSICIKSMTTEHYLHVVCSCWLKVNNNDLVKWSCYWQWVKITLLRDSRRTFLRCMMFRCGLWVGESIRWRTLKMFVRFQIRIQYKHGHDREIE